MSLVFLNTSQGSQSGLADLASLTSQLASGIPCFHNVRITGGLSSQPSTHKAPGELNHGPDGCMANTLLTEPLPGPWWC